jgi:hypothetical protein
MYEGRHKLQPLPSGGQPQRPNTAPFFEDTPDNNQPRVPLRPLSQEQLRHSLSSKPIEN